MRTINLILLFAAACVLFGRGYQHLFFEAPYRAFFLDENHFKWAVDLFTSRSWFDYVTDIDTDRAISLYGKAVGLFLWATIISFFLFETRFWRIPVLLSFLSTVLLAFMAYSYYLDKGFQAAQLMEYTSQVLIPALYAIFKRDYFKERLVWVIKLIVGVTFAGHGLYALGVYPIPGHFVHMVITNLHISNSQAVSFLYFAGVMDFVLAIGLFLPKVDKFFLWYAFVWGLLTALARLTTYITPGSLFWMSVHQMSFEFLIRAPHFLLPLCGIVYGRIRKT